MSDPRPSVADHQAPRRATAHAQAADRFTLGMIQKSRNEEMPHSSPQALFPETCCTNGTLLFISPCIGSRDCFASGGAMRPGQKNSPADSTESRWASWRRGVAHWVRKDAKAERPGPSWLAPSKRHFFGRDFIPLSAFGRPRPGATAPPPRRTGASLSSSAVAIVVPNKSKGNRHSPAKRITSFAGCTGSVHSAGQPHVAVPGAGGDALCVQV